MEYKRISVLIVTYKQQDVIGRNLDSILQQREYGLNEIVICDDCSPDDNWRVITEYASRYPGIIRAYRNETNLGIYGNSNKLMSLRGESDLFCWLEGDDALCDGFFKEAQEFIALNDVNLNEAIGIFSGYKLITPDGKEHIQNNDYFRKYPKRNPYGVYTRGYASWRSGLFTESVLKRFTPAIVSQGLSLAEFLFDGQWFMHIDTPLYLPFISSIYYSGIGVSAYIEETEYRKGEAIIQWDYYIHNLAKNYFDIMWGKSKLMRAQFLSEKPQSYLKRVGAISSVAYSMFVGMIPYGVSVDRIKKNLYIMTR